MRLDIVVRNSQDNQPIPGAAINVYYQHVNGLKTVARNVTVGANGTASVEVRAGNDGSMAPTRAFSWLRAPTRLVIPGDCENFVDFSFQL